MSADSPFTITRFEYERRHLYYLPEALFAELENSIPTYLVGSRGTGKTTLLKALTWEERLRNQSLRAQLNNEPFKRQYLGVYFKLPEIQLQLLERWLTSTEEEVHASVLGLFLDLVWLELALDAVAELTAESVIPIAPVKEHSFVASIGEEYPDLFDTRLTSSRPLTLKDLSRTLRRTKRSLEIAALHRAPVSENVERYPIGQIGSLGKVVGAGLAKLCNGDVERDDDGWRFLICMDEGECLNGLQQRVINTLVRLAEWPVCPIIASVSLADDISSTLIPHITLQKADRQLRVLDEMDNAEFKDIAQGVGTVRVRSVLKEMTVAFDVDRILGSLSINRILQEILQNSVRPKAKALLAEALELGKHPFFRDKQVKQELQGDPEAIPPIYQTYLAAKLHIPIPLPDQPGWERRRQESAQMRKRMVAAYLSICAELGVDVRYASAEMVLEMSDKCMRDFLSQTEEIYRASNKTINKFLEDSVPYSTQYGALKRASVLKRDSLPRSGVRAPLQTGRVVEGLARITAQLQKRGENNAHLKSSERGIFLVSADAKAKKRFASDLELLVDASEAGFLRVADSDEPTWEVRVHTSLAAAYGFSYRGAYYKSRLAVEDIHRLAEAADDAALAAVINDVGGKMGGHDKGDLLPFEGDLL